MWLLETNAQKAEKYAVEIYKQNSFSFDKITGLKKWFPSKLKATKSFKFLTKEVFDQYLSSEPDKLLLLHQNLFDYLFNNPMQEFNQKLFTEYRQDLKEGKPVKRNSQYSVISDDEIKAIKHIFNYDNYISDNPTFSYYLAELLNCNTCTYCNRQYTLTVKDNKGKRVIRPEFDHWFAQSLYPDLALSYYNLIPSCSFCNSVLKNDKETELETHIHPYLDKDSGFKFTYLLNQNGGFDVDIDITATDPVYRKRVENTLRLFKIHEVYGAHSGIELKDLIDLAIANPNDYIETLIYKVMDSLNLDRETVIRLIFGIESNPNRFYYRPMSKFKSDIMEKLKKVYYTPIHGI